MSISSMAFYFLIVAGLLFALVGGYLLALLAIQIGQAYSAKIETDTLLLVLGVVLIGIALWWWKR